MTASSRLRFHEFTLTQQANLRETNPLSENSALPSSSSSAFVYKKAVAYLWPASFNSTLSQLRPSSNLPSFNPIFPNTIFLRVHPPSITAPSRICTISASSPPSHDLDTSYVHLGTTHTFKILVNCPATTLLLPNRYSPATTASAKASSSLLLRSSTGISTLLPNNTAACRRTTGT